MKRFIFAILFISAFSFSAMPGVALAKHHHGRHYYRAAPRSHGVGANANVGVGLGPIHVGVGAGGGIHLHAFPQPKDPPGDPISVNGHHIVHPSDCDLECYVNSNASLAPASAAFVDTASNVKWSSTTGASGNSDMRYIPERFAVSPDTNINNYFVNYVPPRMVTVGGFNVPVTGGNAMYYNPFKHGRYGFWYVHNRKGVDVTAGYGVSPRAGPLPESIGGSAYTVTTVER